MAWSPDVHTLRVPRTARVATLGPLTPASTWWVVLHGYGQLAPDFVDSFRPIVTEDRAVVAPEGLSRFYVDGVDTHEEVGASWMTREARADEIDDYVRALDATIRHLSGDGAPSSLCALGFSQGAATAGRWAALGETALDRLILWGAPLASDLDLAKYADRFRALDLTLVAGTNDSYLGPARRRAAEERIRRHDIAVTIRTFDGGHRLDEDLLQVLAQA